MEFKLDKECTSGDFARAGALIQAAAALDMNMCGYGELARNRHSGNVYIWLDDYPFTLYVSDYCSRVVALWTDPESGDEEVMDVSQTTKLNDLYAWCDAHYARIQL